MGAEGGRYAYEAAERVARRSYGRLVAFLAKRTGDLSRAEDALAEAFAAALADWPKSGVPANPEGWLVTVAKRKCIDGARKQRSRADAAAGLQLLAEELDATAAEA